MASSGGANDIRVKVMQNNQTHELTFARTATIASVKEALEARISAPPARQRIVFRGSLCTDDQTLERLGVQENDVLHVVVRPEDAPRSASTTRPPAARATPAGTTTVTIPQQPAGERPGHAPLASDPGQTRRNRTGAAGTGAGAGTGAEDPGPWMVPHLLTSIETYLQRMTAPEFHPGPVPLYAMAPSGGRSIPDENLTTLTECIQHILQGAYLPHQLQSLLQQSQTDTVGRITPAGGTGSGAAAGSASNNTSSGAAAPTGSANTDQSGGRGRGPGTAATGTGAGTSRSRTTTVHYRYTPLAVAALAELLRRADMHLASALQPQLREQSTSLVASAVGGTDGARSSAVQGALNGLGTALYSSGALLVELGRLTAAVSQALGGNLTALAMNTAAVINPDGSRPAFPPLYARTDTAGPDMDYDGWTGDPYGAFPGFGFGPSMPYSMPSMMSATGSPGASGSTMTLQFGPATFDLMGGPGAPSGPSFGTSTAGGRNASRSGGNPAPAPPPRDTVIQNVTSSSLRDVQRVVRSLLRREETEDLATLAPRGLEGDAAAAAVLDVICQAGTIYRTLADQASRRGDVDTASTLRAKQKTSSISASSITSRRVSYLISAFQSTCPYIFDVLASSSGAVSRPLSIDANMPMFQSLTAQLLDHVSKLSILIQSPDASKAEAARKAAKLLFLEQVPAIAYAMELTGRGAVAPAATTQAAPAVVPAPAGVSTAAATATNTAAPVASSSTQPQANTVSTAQPVSSTDPATVAEMQWDAATPSPSTPSVPTATPSLGSATGATTTPASAGSGSAAAGTVAAPAGLGASGGPRGLGLGLKPPAGQKKKPAGITTGSAAGIDATGSQDPKRPRLDDATQAGRAVLQAMGLAPPGATSSSGAASASPTARSAGTAGGQVVPGAVARPAGGAGAGGGGGLMGLVSQVLGGAAGGGGSAGTGGGLPPMGDLLQMATQVATDPNMAPMMEQAMSALMGGGRGGSDGLRGLLGGLMGGLPPPSAAGGMRAAGASGNTPPISESVVGESIPEADAAERVRQMLREDAARMSAEPVRTLEDLGEAYQALSQGSGVGQGGSGGLGALLGGL